MKKFKYLFRNKHIILFIIGLFIGISYYAVADSIINANQVGYNNVKSKIHVDNVQDAINELWDEAQNECPIRTAYNVTNLIQNGSFENNSYDYGNGVSTNDANTGNHSLYINDTTASNMHWHYTNNVTIPANHVFYVRYAGKTINETTEVFYMLFLGLNLRSNSREFQIVSGITTSTEEANSGIQFGSNSNNVNKEGYIDDLMIIDLTADFGAGNEPTKQWCDENITYFDGTTTIYK